MNKAFLALIVLLFSQSSDSAESSQESLKVVTEILSPYQYYDSQGNLKGLSVEIVKLLCIRLEYQCDIEVYPWARTYHYGLSKPNTLIFTLARTQIREEKFHWIGKVDSERYIFYAMKNKNIKADQLSDLKNYHVAVTRGAVVESFLVENQFLKLERTINFEYALKMLFEERTDLIYANPFVIKLLSQKMGYQFDQLQPVFELPEQGSDLFIAMSIDTDPLILERMKQAFQNLESDNILENIKKKYW